MKLFVWHDPYDIMYGTSSVYAVAETVEEAKAVACSAKATNCGQGGSDGNPHLNPEKMKLGEPDRILDVPCAVWDYYCE